MEGVGKDRGKLALKVTSVLVLIVGVLLLVYACIIPGFQPWYSGAGGVIITLGLYFTGRAFLSGWED